MIDRIEPLLRQILLIIIRAPAAPTEAYITARIPTHQRSQVSDMLDRGSKVGALIIDRSSYPWRYLIPTDMARRNVLLRPTARRLGLPTYECTRSYGRTFCSQ